MVGVEEGREFRFRGDLYSQQSTFPLVIIVIIIHNSLFDAVFGDSSAIDCCYRATSLA